MFSGKTMKKRIIIATLVLAGVHLALAVISVIIAFGSGMEAFDNPDYQLSAIDRFVGPLAEILMQPGMSLWTPWMSKNMPNIVEWTLCEPFMGPCLCSHLEFSSTSERKDIKQQRTLDF
jgi:hypothetical protein